MPRGYKVAICEQVEDPALAKGIVKRDIIRVITPGTVIESSMLAEDKNNYLCSIVAKRSRSSWKAGICFADISTGEAYATELPGPKVGNAIVAELCRFMPSEILITPPSSTSRKSPTTSATTPRAARTAGGTLL